VLLDEEVIFEKGAYKRIRRYWLGWHKEKGTLIPAKWTLSFMDETIEETDVIKPSITFEVNDIIT
jgi:hypothetical protein